MRSTLHRPVVWILTALLGLAVASAQQDDADRLTVPFSDPTRPGRVEVGLLNGSITVTGYDGKDVLIEARAAGEDASDEHAPEEESDDESRRKRAGLRRIPNLATGLTVEEKRNVVTVGTEAMQQTIDLAIRVPRKCSLELSTVNSGELKIVGVAGEIEVNNTNGGIEVHNVSGSVVAHALNGDVVVVFDKIEAQKAMSFSSLNGDIDVTLPADVRANIRTKTDNGEIYSDFDIKLERASVPKAESTTGKKGPRYKVKIDNAMSGTLNGGGPELRFETFNGDIYIRKCSTETKSR
jgi:hypothetical protein